jgi:hypothetical protein
MEFRWVAFITLWTFLSGPVFGSAPQPRQDHRPRAVLRDGGATTQAAPPAAKN